MDIFHYSASPSYPLQATPFEAKHPMFQYQAGQQNHQIQQKIKKADVLFVVGMGGSVFPLQAFRDALELTDKIIFLDSVDPDSINRRLLHATSKSLFFVVSKSGETLEVKALLSELLSRGFSDQIVIVCDSQKGSLRQWTNESKLESQEIPSEIGGRFTNFSPFHYDLLEALGFPAESIWQKARSAAEDLKKDPVALEKFYQALFPQEGESPRLVLWNYSSRLSGFCKWVQQALAESLGKMNKGGKRVGVLPILLSGPDDQHAVLQYLREGPQEHCLWFVAEKKQQAEPFRKLPEFCSDLKNHSLASVLEILYQSTKKSFVENLANPETAQEVMAWEFNRASILEDLVQAIVFIQAFVEYAGDKLEVNAFDQPGVERGKELARELLEAATQ